MAIVQFRVDDELKKEATALFENLGLDLSSAMRMFLKRSVACKGIPFPMVIAEEAYQASGAIEVLKDAQEISKRNDNSEMTIDEIAKAKAERKSGDSSASIQEYDESVRKARAEDYSTKKPYDENEEW